MNNLYTTRLFLRKLMDDDSRQIFMCWAKDPEATKYLGYYAHNDPERTRKVVQQWVKEYENEDCCRYGIIRQRNGRLIGMINVDHFVEGNPVVEGVITRDLWGEGYMQEALLAVSEELFKNGYKKVLAEINEENRAGDVMVKKCGFRYIGKISRPCSKEKPEIVTLNQYEKVNDPRC